MGSAFTKLRELAHVYLFTKEAAIQTQPSMLSKPRQYLPRQIAQIALQFALYGIQAIYDLHGTETIPEIIMWLLTSANFMVVLFGSCRAFDRVLFVELFLGAFFSFFYLMHFAIPVIAVMLFQCYMRYDQSYIEHPDEPVEDPDEHSVEHEIHPDNWRNWMYVNSHED